MINNMGSFQFTQSSHYGWYFITYTTERGDYWKASINDMTLIDDTKNSDNPTKAAYNRLRKAVQAKGTHYRKNGEPIFD